MKTSVLLSCLVGTAVHGYVCQPLPRTIRWVESPVMRVPEEPRFSLPSFAPAAKSPKAAAKSWEAKRAEQAAARRAAAEEKAAKQEAMVEKRRKGIKALRALAELSRVRQARRKEEQAMARQAAVAQQQPRGRAVTPPSRPYDESPSTPPPRESIDPGVPELMSRYVEAVSGLAVVRAQLAVARAADAAKSWVEGVLP